MRRVSGVNTNPIRFGVFFGVPDHLLCSDTVGGDARDELPAAEAAAGVEFKEILLDLFGPSRGLWQGDPLSLFLFPFVAGGLSALLNKAIDDQLLSPFKVFCRARGVSHLFILSKLGYIYASCNGQLINPSKCSILFGVMYNQCT
jgi:hypothetical protein